MNRIINKMSPNKRFNAPFHSTSSSKKRKLVALNSDLHPRTREFYSQTLKALKDSGLPVRVLIISDRLFCVFGLLINWNLNEQFMVGGTYAVAAYTGIDRSTKVCYSLLQSLGLVFVFPAHSIFFLGLGPVCEERWLRLYNGTVVIPRYVMNLC